MPRISFFLIKIGMENGINVTVINHNLVLNDTWILLSLCLYFSHQHLKRHTTSATTIAKKAEGKGVDLVGVVKF